MSTIPRSASFPLLELAIPRRLGTTAPPGASVVVQYMHTKDSRSRWRSWPHNQRDYGAQSGINRTWQHGNAASASIFLSTRRATWSFVLSKGSQNVTLLICKSFCQYSFLLGTYNDSFRVLDNVASDHRQNVIVQPDEWTRYWFGCTHGSFDGCRRGAVAERRMW